MPKEHRPYGFFFWLHLVSIFFLWTSPFLVDLKWLPLGLIALYFQWRILGGCACTYWEFGHFDTPFYWYYLNRWGVKISRKGADILTDYVIPIWVLIFGVIWQWVLGHEPLLF